MNVYVAKKVTNSPLVGGNILQYMPERKEMETNYLLTVLRLVELLPFSQSHEAVRINIFYSSFVAQKEKLFFLGKSG